MALNGKAAADLDAPWGHSSRSKKGTRQALLPMLRKLDLDLNKSCLTFLTVRVVSCFNCSLFYSTDWKHNDKTPDDWAKALLALQSFKRKCFISGSKTKVSISASSSSLFIFVKEGKLEKDDAVTNNTWGGGNCFVNCWWIHIGLGRAWHSTHTAMTAVVVFRDDALDAFAFGNNVIYIVSIFSQSVILSSFSLTSHICFIITLSFFWFQASSLRIGGFQLTSEAKGRCVSWTYW